MKEEYLKKLEKELIDNDVSNINFIIEDYEKQIDLFISQEKSFEEIEEILGTPANVALIEKNKSSNTKNKTSASFSDSAVIVVFSIFIISATTLLAITSLLGLAACLKWFIFSFKYFKSTKEQVASFFITLLIFAMFVLFSLITYKLSKKYIKTIKDYKKQNKENL